ncbi:MAG TPA: YbaB/EbfC family nucleoid-associated protein [Acidobacteriota bacterium]|nr:YbaB/EbfC family nucleoid-associated protein [Acidobacteriota bacterium]
MKMNMNKLMQQVQETQKKIQDELAAMRVTASSGGGMVEVTLDGSKQMISIKIDPQAVNSEDVEMLQDLIVAAYNEAFRRADEQAAEKMGAMTGNLKIPGLGNMF